MENKILYWLRRDLRISDNPCLNYVEKNKKSLILVYILDSIEKEAIGKASFWWLQKSLEELKQQYKKKFNLDLIVLEGEPDKIINNLTKKYKIKEVIWNRLYSKKTIKRDSSLKKLLEKESIVVSTFNSHLLSEPWEIKNNSGEYFKVFTPYWKNAYPYFINQNYQVNIVRKLLALDHSESISDFNFLPTKNWYKKFEQYWIPGEVAALKKVDKYLLSNIDNYKINRDRPDIDETSRISPHLKFGEISPRLIVNKINKTKKDNPSTISYLSEIGWREFAYTLLYYTEDLKNIPINKKFENFKWNKNKVNLNSWKKGNTGFPIIDAAMIQIYEQGWMHNRLRMIVGSFLVKNLRLHWHEGERYFQDCLLDYDEASNPAGWQWVAGCGADAAPYFRIFNPILQSEKFDPEAKFILSFLPQLKIFEKSKFIFQPWLKEEILKKLQNNSEYQLPIVRLDVSRNEALEAFKSMNQNKS